MCRIFFAFFMQFAFFLNPCFAQKEYNNWYFGDRASFNFQNGSPRVQMNSEMVARASSVSISDKNTGDLLFYSNSRTVWNRNHQVMPNGNQLKGDSSNSQSVFAVPLPNQANKYYLFTIEQVCSPTSCTDSLNLYYSVLDMNLDNGLGDIEANQKNIPLLSRVTGGMTVVPHQNGQDFWFITHTYLNNDFYVYLINVQGIQAPQIQSIGSNHSFGYYKASPNGQKLACPITTAQPLRYQPFELFDFDAQNGLISNPINLGYYLISISLSFSPDNSKLYLNGILEKDTLEANNADSVDIIAQFDLSSSDREEILASRSFIAIQNPNFNPSNNISIQGFGAFVMEMAPDGKIYGGGVLGIDNLPNPNLIVIARPNRPGFDCEISIEPFNFGSGRTVLRGLPSQIQSVFNNLEPVGSNICAAEDILVYPNPSQGAFNLQISEDCDQVRLIRLFNALGQEFIRREITSGVPDMLDINYLAAGVYFLEIQFLNTKITKKIIKE